MTSVHEPTQGEQSKITSLNKTNHSLQDFTSMYTNHSNIFQNQIENKVLKRNELFSKAYLEYLKYWNQFFCKTFELQNDLLYKNGFELKFPEIYNAMFKKYYDAIRSSYSNQTQINETFLKMINGFLKLLNENMGGFTNLISSVYSWWIPSAKN